jgi:hypothetical protein
VVSTPRQQPLEEWDPAARPLLVAVIEGSSSRVRALHDYPDNPRKGASQPLFMACDDGFDYVVKFPVPGWTKALANELIGARLLSALGLPVPPAAVVDVSPELVSASGVLQRRAIAPGEYFGTRRLPAPLDLSDAVAGSLHPSMVENRTDAAGVIAFDSWVKNTDRNEGNLLLVSVKGSGTARFRMYAIDHGLILTGQAWTAESLAAVTRDPSRAGCHPFIERCVWDAAEFAPTRAAIESFSADGLRAKLFPVPRAWGLADAEGDAAVAFLDERRGILPEILQTFALNPDKAAAV